MPDERLCLALDVPLAEATDWVARCAPQVTWFKIGLRLFCAAGPRIVEQVRVAGARRIFLDLKLHDIPNTVADAVREIADLGVDLLTLHTGGGGEMMRAAVAVAGQTRLVGVTVLTSLDEPALAPVGLKGPLRALVERRARAAREAGLDGVVCSGSEAGLLRAQLGPAALLVTPGVRFADGEAGDQQRTVTPATAIAAGADLLVIGRMVTAAPDPDRALARLSAEIGR